MLFTTMVISVRWANQVLQVPWHLLIASRRSENAFDPPHTILLTGLICSPGPWGCRLAATSVHTNECSPTFSTQSPGWGVTCWPSSLSYITLIFDECTDKSSGGGGGASVSLQFIGLEV